MCQAPSTQHLIFCEGAFKAGKIFRHLVQFTTTVDNLKWSISNEAAVNDFFKHLNM